MKTRLKRLLSGVLALAMVVAMMPTMAFADECDHTYGTEGVASVICQSCGYAKEYCYVEGDTLYVLKDGYNPGHFMSYADQIKNVVVCDGVTTVSYLGNRWVPNVESVTLSSTVETIDDNAFYGSKLTSITLNEGLKKIGGHAFQESTLPSITIPSSVKTIGAYAFDACTNLASVTLNEGLEEIYDYAFRGAGVTSITFPDSVKSYDRIFQNCTELTNVAFKGSAVLNSFTFEGCSKLKNVTFCDDAAKTVDLGTYAFDTCSSLEEIVLADSVKAIGQCTLKSCSNLKKITIVNKELTLRNGAFIGVGTETSPVTLILPEDWDENNMPIEGQQWNYGWFVLAPTHEADTSTYGKDANNHWNPCSVEGCTEHKYNETAHSYTNGVCVCGYTEPNYLTFTAQKANSRVSIRWASAESMEYKLNGGDWATYTAGTGITLANVGDSVRFKGKNVMTDSYNHFSMTGRIAASGSVTSLTDGNGGDSNVALPVKCYYSMFKDCTVLTTAPELPATTLSDTCYFLMFSGCTALTTAPELPAVTLANNCYTNMFAGCAGLTTAPELPATTLADNCYYAMFSGCTGLSIVNEQDDDHTVEWKIHGTQSVHQWCLDMFKGCTGLNLDGNGGQSPKLNTTYYQRKANTTTYCCDDTNHWFVCNVEGCTERHDVTPHSYENGVCVCGEKDPTAPFEEVIDYIKYRLDPVTLSATIIGYEGTVTELDVSTVTSGDKEYTVTAVGDSAFYEHPDLTTVNLPNVTELYGSAFYKCAKLTSINLPEATTIGDNALSYCSSLTSLYLPKVTKIGSFGLRNCKNLTYLYLPRCALSKLGRNALMGCSKTTISLPCDETKGIKKNQSLGYASGFTFDYTHDWSNKDGVCKKCDKACTHSFEEDVCTVCGMDKPVPHTASTTYGSDETNHWFTCSVEGCTEKFNETAHSYTNGVCVCGMEESAPTPDPVAYIDRRWDDTQKKVVDESKSVENYIPVTSGMTALGTANTETWYVVNEDVEFNTRITINGTVNLILADGKTLTASEGITVAGENTLNIYGQSDDSGKLIATGGYAYAGIGGGYGSDGGEVTINGGTVTAEGGSSNAGIGGGKVTINGGTVTATGGREGAGIGGGLNGAGGTVTITGGTVTATGGYFGAGIGGGDFGDGGKVIITGGTVTATGKEGGAGIGGGYEGAGGTVTLGEGVTVKYGADAANATNAVTSADNTNNAGGIKLNGAAYAVARYTAPAPTHEADATTYGKDANNHWFTCSVEGCTEHTYEPAAHTFENGVCTVCGEECTHSYKETGKKSWVNIDNNFSLNYDVVCEKCGMVTAEKAEMSKSTSAGKTTYTATTPEGNTYAKTVVEKLTVTYNGKDTDYEYLEIATLKSDVAVDWYVDGVKVAGNTKTYCFAVTRNVAITTAVASKAEPIITLNVSDRVALDSTGRQSVTLTASWTVPKGYTYVGAGFMRAYSAAPATLTAVSQLTTTNATSLKTPNGTYDYTINMSATTASQKALNVVAYLTYKDANGTLYTDYSAIMQSMPTP